MAIRHRAIEGDRAAVLRKEDEKLLTGKGRYVDDIDAARHAASGVRAQPLRARESGHRHFRGAGDARRRRPSSPATTSSSRPASRAARTRRGTRSTPTPGARDRQRAECGRARRRLSRPTYAAADAAAAVEVDNDPLPALVPPEEAVAEGAPRLHESASRQPLLHAPEPLDGRLRRGGRRRRGRDPPAGSNQRLTRGDRAARRRRQKALDGQVTLYTSTQVPHFVKTFVSVVNGTSEAKVRVIAPDVGGAFGSKLNTYAEEFAAAAASAAARPVKWIEERSSRCPRPRHGRATTPLELDADNEGRILALRRTRPGLRPLPAAADADHPPPHAVHVAGRLRHPEGLRHRRRRCSRTPCRRTPSAAPAGPRPHT